MNVTNESDSVQVVASFRSAVEAAAFVGVLKDAGIRADSVGEHTAAFAAEAPGEVEVLVSEADFDQAKQIHLKICENGVQVDWSQVDVGDDTPITDGEVAANEAAE